MDYYIRISMLCQQVFLGLGVDRLAAELVLIDPKDRPSEENSTKLRAFCDRLSGLQGS